MKLTAENYLNTGSQYDHDQPFDCQLFELWSGITSEMMRRCCTLQIWHYYQLKNKERDKSCFAIPLEQWLCPVHPMWREVIIRTGSWNLAWSRNTGKDMFTQGQYVLLNPVTCSQSKVDRLVLLNFCLISFVTDSGMSLYSSFFCYRLVSISLPFPIFIRLSDWVMHT